MHNHRYAVKRWIFFSLKCQFTIVLVFIQNCCMNVNIRRVCSRSHTCRWSFCYCYCLFVVSTSSDLVKVWLSSYTHTRTHELFESLLWFCSDRSKFAQQICTVQIFCPPKSMEMSKSSILISIPITISHFNHGYSYCFFFLLFWFSSYNTLPSNVL